MNWKPLSTTRDGHGEGRFRVVHPYHPLAGQEFELVGYAHTWGEHRVFYRAAGSERVRSLPAIWTDVVEADAFVALAGGRSLFGVEDLRALVALVREQTEEPVSEIMP